MADININELNDQQKTWLTQMSYLNINEEGRKKLERGESIKVSELGEYLDNPDAPWCGNAGLGKVADAASKVVVNQDAFESQSELVDKLNELGLGDIEITNASKEHQLGDSGFQALTFKDSFDNVGISYRGSDLDQGHGWVDDWLHADFKEFFTGTSRQMDEALKYFDENKSLDGQTAVFGHSLGGQLSSHVLCERTQEVSQAFVINANPINSARLDTPEKIEAFNDPEKYQFNAVAGDLVSHFKGHHGYEQNVNYVSNNHTQPGNIVGDHVVQAASFDENGNFIKASKEEVREEMAGGRLIASQFMDKVREGMNKLSDGLKSFDDKMQDHPGLIADGYRNVRDTVTSISNNQDLKDYANELANGLRDGFKDIFNKEDIQQLFNREDGQTFADSLKQFFDEKSHSFDKVDLNPIKDFAQDKFQDAKETATHAYEAVRDFDYKGLVNDIQGLEMQDVKDFIQQDLPQMTRDGFEGLTGFDMDDVIAGAKEKVQDLGDAIKGFDMQELGSEVQQRFEQGWDMFTSQNFQDTVKEEFGNIIHNTIETFDFNGQEEMEGPEIGG